MSHKKPDYILLSIVVALVLIGLVVLSSASIVLSQDNFGQSYYYLKHQLIFGVGAGIAAFMIAQKIDYRKWKKIATFAFVASTTLLALVLIPGISYSYGGAQRWIALGGFSFQPSEVMKLGLILYIAHWLSSRDLKKIKSFQEGLVPFSLITGIVGILLILQPDLSTLGITMMIALAIFFLGGGKISHITLLIASGIGLLLAFIKIVGYNIKRIDVFLHPELDPQGIGYQINQALLAIGSGGIAGLGLGHSRQKYNYLPEPIGDSIFAIISEELGFIAAAIIVALFIAFALRGFKIAKNAPDAFGKLLAGGITSWIIIQAFINISAITGLIPLTGVPLPFISYGGSALLMELAGMGILINISKFST